MKKMIIVLRHATYWNIPKIPLKHDFMLTKVTKKILPTQKYIYVYAIIPINIIIYTMHHYYAFDTYYYARTYITKNHFYLFYISNNK